MALLPDCLTWDAIKAAANSNFTTALLGSLAGAYGGAWAAQRIAEKTKRRDELRTEIGHCNAVIELAGGICSTCLNVKEQHILPLKQSYDRQKELVHAYFRGLTDGTIPRGTVADVGPMDLRTLDTVRFRWAQLDSLVMEKLTVRGRARMLMPVLVQSLETLNSLIHERNERVAALKADDLPDKRKIALLFALPFEDRSRDETYSDLMNGLSKTVDDCVYFSQLICKDVGWHGRGLRLEFVRKFRGDVESIQRMSFAEPELRGVMPSDADYPTWHTGFSSKVPRTRRRWLKRWMFLFRKIMRSTFKWLTTPVLP